MKAALVAAAVLATLVAVVRATEPKVEGSSITGTGIELLSGRFRGQGRMDVFLDGRPRGQFAALQSLQSQGPSRVAFPHR